MSNPALIAETTEDGRVRYEYRDHGAASVTFNYPHSLADEDEMGEKYPQEPDSEAENLEEFIERASDNNLILRIWIDGT